MAVSEDLFQAIDHMLGSLFQCRIQFACLILLPHNMVPLIVTYILQSGLILSNILATLLSQLLYTSIAALGVVERVGKGRGNGGVVE